MAAGVCCVQQGGGGGGERLRTQDLEGQGGQRSCDVNEVLRVPTGVPPFSVSIAAVDY